MLSLSLSLSLHVCVAFDYARGRAYPDMLEVGKLASFQEDRSHFGAWCVVSAPLILGHDLADAVTNSLIWPA